MSVQTTNHTGGTAGKPEVNDTIAFTFSKPMDPSTLYTGWSVGSTPDVTNATVTFNDSPTGNGTNKNNDSLTITGASGTVNLGSVINMEGDIVPTQGGSYSFTATLHYALVGGQSVVTVTLTSLNSGGSTVGTATQRQLHMVARRGGSRPCWEPDVDYERDKQRYPVLTVGSAAFSRRVSDSTSRVPS